MTATLGAQPQQRRLAPSRPPLARTPVLAVSVVTAAALLAVSGRYGFFGDELYFVSAGHHLSWGYADQPPLLPLIALLMDTLAPGSLTALRVPAILATAAGVVVSALIAREFGGQRRAQIFTAACHGIAFASVTTTLATPVFDIFMWTVISWLVVRWVRTHSEGMPDDRLLPLTGVAVAVALQVKFQVAVFVGVLLLSILVLGPREMLRRRMVWVAAAIAIVPTVPTLLWQAANGWPQLEMGSAVAAETASIGPLVNAVLMVAGMGVGIGIFLGCFGWWRLLRTPSMRPYRFFGVAAVVVVLFFVATNGRAYYICGLFPVLWAAGAVGLQHRREMRLATGRRDLNWVAWSTLAISMTAPLMALPLAPVESYAGRPYDVTNFVFLGQIGWPEMTDSVAEVYRNLPPGQRSTTAIVANDYWAASALEYYGPERGLPRAYSGGRGFWYFGQPPEHATSVIHVGELTPAMKKYFGDIRQVGRLDNGFDIRTQIQGAPVYLATEQRAPWSRIWPEFRRINLMD